MVVHAVEPFYFDGNMNLHIATKSDALWVAIIDSAARACVPLFVMASCYLLFPLKVPSGVFFRRRIMRILVPFFIWSCVYLWRFGGSFKELLFNFPGAAGHLWFIPMLFGLYLAMPLFSPWAHQWLLPQRGADEVGCHHSPRENVPVRAGVWLFYLLVRE
jgi:surface polysaccharide O-acyltransferase-like enzyme